VAQAAKAFAPGRVNLVGEHTDYNRGLCLPFAIALGVTVAARPAGGRAFEAHAADLGERDRFDVARVRPGQDARGWRALVRGAAAELAASGIEQPPCRLEIAGSVPRGAGLASSAALCVALCLALIRATGAPEPGRLELARLCSRVEHRWAGAETGLLDQLASLEGRSGHVLRIDMLGPDVRPLPLELHGHHLVVLPSGAPRELSGSGYNARRAECAAACRELGVDSLRDAAPSGWDALPDPLRRRVRHVVSENARVDAMIEALGAGRMDAAGRVLDESHASLRDDFDVSLGAVERAVEACRAAGALGARLMGGGFGGSVLALMPPGRAAPPGSIAVAPAGGARILPGT
jgi:galactokinase